MRRLALENWPSHGKSGYTTCKSLKSQFSQNCYIFEKDFSAFNLAFSKKSKKSGFWVFTYDHPHTQYNCTIKMVEWSSWHVQRIINWRLKVRFLIAVVFLFWLSRKVEVKILGFELRPYLQHNCTKFMNEWFNR